MSEPVQSRVPLYYAYGALGIQALLPIIAGSFASVKTPKSVKKQSKKTSQAVILDPDATDDEDEEEAEERIGLTDSLLFPVIASITLVSLFLIFKYVDSKWINQIIGGYFAIASVLATQFTSTYLIKGAWTRVSSKPHTKYHFRIEKGYKQVAHFPLTVISLVVIPFSVLLPIIYIYLDKPWYLTNILSFTFAVSSISMLKLDGFKTGGALLAGLFFYDIGFVFYTPVMVTVAKSLDAPIKVLAPRDLFDSDAGFSMLGLGDIVIPGIFISLALRYDFASYVSRVLKKNPKATPRKEDSYSKPYFWTVLLAYILGLTTTVVVMHTYKAAQPALLYLSPACIGAVLLLGTIRGELPRLWSWSDEQTTESEITEALTFESASNLPETPIVQATVNTVKTVDEADQKSPSSGAEREGNAAEDVEDDEDWMNLGNSQETDATKSRKKKANKKKK